MVKKRLEKPIEKIDINKFPNNLETELTILGKLFDELQKIKECKSKDNCAARNMLHILLGQIEIRGVDIRSEVHESIRILDEGITELNWTRLDQLILVLYRIVFLYCN